MSQPLQSYDDDFIDIVDEITTPEPSQNSLIKETLNTSLPDKVKIIPNTKPNHKILWHCPAILKTSNFTTAPIQIESEPEDLILIDGKAESRTSTSLTSSKFKIRNKEIHAQSSATIQLKPICETTKKVIPTNIRTMSGGAIVTTNNIPDIRNPGNKTLEIINKSGTDSLEESSMTAEKSKEQNKIYKILDPKTQKYITFASDDVINVGSEKAKINDNTILLLVKPQRVFNEESADDIENKLPDATSNSVLLVCSVEPRATLLVGSNDQLNPPQQVVTTSRSSLGKRRKNLKDRYKVVSPPGDALFRGFTKPQSKSRCFKTMKNIIKKDHKSIKKIETKLRYETEFVESDAPLMSLEDFSQETGRIEDLDQIPDPVSDLRFVLVQINEQVAKIKKMENVSPLTVQALELIKKCMEVIQLPEPTQTYANPSKRRNNCDDSLNRKKAFKKMERQSQN